MANLRSSGVDVSSSTGSTGTGHEQQLRSHPSWCLVVITKYFMPAASAAAAQTVGSNLVGLKVLDKPQYVARNFVMSACVHSEHFFGAHSAGLPNWQTVFQFSDHDASKPICE